MYEGIVCLSYKSFLVSSVDTSLLLCKHISCQSTSWQSLEGAFWIRVNLIWIWTKFDNFLHRRPLVMKACQYLSIITKYGCPVILCLTSLAFSRQEWLGALTPLHRWLCMFAVKASCHIHMFSRCTIFTGEASFFSLLQSLLTNAVKMRDIWS